MALHGKIEVNGETIGQWGARRLQARTWGVCTYECEVQMLSGSLKSGAWCGFIEHRYDDGAPALIAKIMTAASQERVAVPDESHTR